MSTVITVVIGNKETGKTTLVKQMMKASPLPKKLVIDTHASSIWADMETFDDPEGANIKVDPIHPDILKHWQYGYGITYGKNKKEILNIVDNDVYNTVVVIEDAVRFFRHKLSDAVQDIIINTKQHNVQLIIVYHLLTQPPADLLDIADYLVLKKTHSKFPKQLRDRYSEAAQEAFERVRIHKNPFYYETIALRG